MIPTRRYASEEVLWAVWARRRTVLWTFVIATAATVAVSTRLPNRFRGEALILAIPLQGGSADLRGNSGPLKDRLPTVTQQILSRARLEHIVRELDLFAEDRRIESMQTVIDRMRRRIETPIVEGSQSFRVTYEAETPALALQVTERVAALFIDENSNDRAAQAHETRAFLDTELDDARRRLAEQEQRLEAYRQRFRAELPTRLQLNIQAVQSAQSQIHSLSELLTRDHDRRLFVARQLADLQSEPSLSSASEELALSGPITAPLDAARAELRNLELRLTPQHPDVVRAKQRVADLEVKARSDAAPAANGETRPQSLTDSQIARLNKLKELKVELAALDQQIAAKVAQEAAHRREMQTYQARVDAAATREAELASLTRDYDALQNLYRTLAAKSEDAKIAESLERRQVGAQFKILDAPRRPDRPSGPNRVLINVAGALFGFGFGFALALLAEFRDRSVKVEADIHAVLNLPVLAQIPTMQSAGERRRHAFRWVYSVVVAMVVAVCATALWWTFAMK